MGLLKSRKNKKFDYTSRYYEHDSEGNPLVIKQKFDDYRVTLGANKGLKTKFNNALSDLKGPQNKSTNKRILLIIIILILLFLFFIEFDLSIFRLKE